MKPVSDIPGKTYLNRDDTALLEQAATNLRDRLLIRVLIRTGCRISEALALMVDSINVDGGTITILHLKSHIRLACPQCNGPLSRGARFCPGCGRGVDQKITSQFEHRRIRTIPVDPETLDLIKEYTDRGGPVLRNGKRLIFGINRHRAWQVIGECAARAGLSRLMNPETGKARGVSPHRLRDAFAVHAVKLDDSPDSLRMLQEQLGHQSISTTMGYRKIAGDELKNWYRRLWQEPDK